MFVVGMAFILFVLSIQAIMINYLTQLMNKLVLVSRAKNENYEKKNEGSTIF